jgi:hypothetical protein
LLNALFAMAAVLVVGAGLATAQITTPFPYMGLVMDGQPVVSVPYNPIVAGPAASQVQDASQVAPPVYASGGCSTTPVIAGNPYSFKFTNGATGCSGSTLVLTLPAAAHGWACHLHDITTPGTYEDQSAAASTTSVQFTNYTRTTGVALTWLGSDVLIGGCTPY